MYRSLAVVYPGKLKESYKQLLLYSNIKLNEDNFLGFIFVFGIGLALIFSLFLANLIRVPLFILFPVFFFLFEFAVYMWLVLNADKKGKAVEEVLPDALQLMSSNLRAGFTVDRALLLSAREEFGLFKDEINTVGKEITMGKDLIISLLNMTERIKSRKLKKTIMLITSGLKSGGELASLLDQAAENLRGQELVEQKVRSNVLMYVIFIFFAIGFGSPILFGLSSFLVQTLTKNLANITLPKTALTAMPLSVTQIGIPVEFVIVFALISLATTSILGSLVIGLISKGNQKAGVKFIPLLLVMTIGLFFLVRFIISRMLGSLFMF